MELLTVSQAQASFRKIHGIRNLDRNNYTMCEFGKFINFRFLSICKIDTILIQVQVQDPI